MNQKLEQLRRSIGGRPKKSSSMQRVSVYLEPDQLMRLELLAKKKGMGLSQLARFLIYESAAQLTSE